MDFERVVPAKILDDLCCRFVINVPEEERRDLNRIFFQIENAHWFYIDFYSKNYPNRKPCVLREFAHQVFRHIPFLQPFAGNVDDIFEEWKEYKFCVPTFGAILLDEDLSHILLVQNYRSSWGFPKGKVNKDEPPYQCAIREVNEETGFDISHLIDINDYIECNVNKQIIRLYIIPGVKRDTKFIPKTRNEIKSVSWFPICDIPLNKKDAIIKQSKTGNGANTFYMVSPFLKKIRHWIYDYNMKPRRHYLRQRHRSCSDIDYERNRGSSFNFKESVETFQGYGESREDITVANIKDRFDISEDDTIPTKLVSHTSEITNLLPEEQLNTLESKPLLPIIKQNNSVDSRYIGSDDTSKPKITRAYSLCESACTSFNQSLPLPFGILSDSSAFRIVDMSNKVSTKTERENNGSLYRREEFSSVHTEFDDTSNSLLETGPNGLSVVPYKPLDCIPGWKNFQFNVNSILESMNEAIKKTESSTHNANR